MLDRRTFLLTGMVSVAAGRHSISAAMAAPGDEAKAGMNHKKIPASGEALPVIGMGTWQTFDVGAGPAQREPLQEVLRSFADGGAKLIDSSPMYGKSEDVVGDLTAALGLRPRLFVATKVWTTGKDQGIRQMEDSMRKLRVEKLDLMQVHNLVDVNTHLATLANWKKEGRVRYVGVTHYTSSAHDEVTRVIQSHPLEFVQINYSVGEREAERRLLDTARERGVAVIANRPFAGGGLLGRLSHTPLPPFAAELQCTSWAQLLLKFVVSHRAVTCAIPATSKVEHLLDNLKAGAGPMPDEAMRTKIAAAAMS